MKEIVSNTIKLIEAKQLLEIKDIAKAEQLWKEQKCILLFVSSERVNIEVRTKKEDLDIILAVEEDHIYPIVNKSSKDWDMPSLAALLHLNEKLSKSGFVDSTGMRYTREGMIKRVLAERSKKAEKENYKIKYADNIYGEHTLTNDRGMTYKVTLRDFEKETGYIDSPDLKVNKLGTTKHLMFAFEKLKKNKSRFKKLKKIYPFIEIYLDPLNDYCITYHYPHEMDKENSKLIKKYFGKKNIISEKKVKHFLGFVHQAEKYDNIKIRKEVLEKVETEYSNDSLEKLKKKTKLSYSKIKAKLFTYQKEGVKFATFKKGAIIADEMGLGKTLQAITVAILKKKIFKFERALIICPASLKAQWKSEIEKFTSEKATIVEGFPSDRAEIYKKCKDYFLILNYETILRDSIALNKYPADFIVLDEAQRIKNYTTKTATSLKSLKRNHSLIITGTPIENKLIDLYSIVQFVDPYFLSPLWEFSYQHCYFDPSSLNRITGYYNLSQLKKRMSEILIRREKRNVIKQLPSVQQINVPVEMHPQQEEYHSSFAHNVARILRKKYRTPYDMQRLMLFLTNMRMVCNSTYLIDRETNYSPKLDELKHILLEKLDVANNKRKIIIFSEWIRSHQIIGELLRELNIGYTELNGKVPVKKRGKIIAQFENDEECRVFLSTEAGGAGLNLQMADTVINFELPWNPAKKNQRIGRIDRLGQKNTKLTVLNFITRYSIETKIATGLILKQNLFEGVLDTDSTTDTVDFSAKGRSQFLSQLEEMLDGLDPEIFNNDSSDSNEEKETVVEDINLETKEQSKLAESNTDSLSEERKPKPQEKIEQMESVMNNGLEFLAGLYKMSTGEEMAASDKKIEIDKKTGEVVMRFKMKV